MLYWTLKRYKLWIFLFTPNAFHFLRYTVSLRLASLNSSNSLPHHLIRDTKNQEKAKECTRSTSSNHQKKKTRDLNETAEEILGRGAKILQQRKETERATSMISNGASSWLERPQRERYGDSKVRELRREEREDRGEGRVRIRRARVDINGPNLLIGSNSAQWAKFRPQMQGLCWASPCLSFSFDNQCLFLQYHWGSNRQAHSPVRKSSPGWSNKFTLIPTETRKPANPHQSPAIGTRRLVSHEKFWHALNFRSWILWIACHAFDSSIREDDELFTRESAEINSWTWL